MTRMHETREQAADEKISSFDYAQDDWITTGFIPFMVSLSNHQSTRSSSCYVFAFLQNSRSRFHGHDHEDLSSPHFENRNDF
jgi:hypothetical protein